MWPAGEWILALGALGGAFMLVLSGFLLMFGALFSTRRLMPLAMDLLVYGTVTMVAVAVPTTIKVLSGDWRSWLPGFIDYVKSSLLEQDAFVYAICILGLYVGFGLLRHLVALFVGYRRVDTTVDRTLSVSVVRIAAILRWPLQLLMQAIRSQRCSSSSGNRVHSDVPIRAAAMFREGDAVRQILVISTGLAPQVVTEMLWWFVAREDASRVVPDFIHIVTTRRGAEVVREQLLGADGKLAEFCREFGLDDLNGHVQVWVPTEADLNPGDDTRDLDTNIGYANLVTRLLRDLTADPGTRIHASLAGGRKTMSFYMGYAMSLLGREHDELSHVLVSPPALENSPDFWWKPIRERIVWADRSGELCSTEDAVIDVAPIPFARLRYLMSQDLFDAPAVDFRRFVGGAQAGVECQRVVLTDSRLEVRVGDHAVRLAPKKYCFYRLLAEIRKDRRKGAGPDGIGACHEGWLTMRDIVSAPAGEPFAPEVERFLEIYEDLPQGRVATRGKTMRERYGNMLPDALQKEFNQEIANTNRRYLETLDYYIARDRARIRRVAGNPKGGTPARFGLVFDPHQIEIIAD